MEKRHKEQNLQWKHKKSFRTATPWQEETISEVFSEFPSNSNSFHSRELTREIRNQVVDAPPGTCKEYGGMKMRGSSVASCSSLMSCSSGESFTDLLPMAPIPEDPLASFPNYSQSYSPESSKILNSMCIEETLKDHPDNFEKESKSLMTNIDFFKTVNPLQNKLSDASIRLQSLLGNYTEHGFEGSSLFKNLKSNLVPYVEDFANVLETIPRVLSSTSISNSTKSSVEIGTSTKYQICLASFEKAVSKYSIKDAAVALAECDLFLSKNEKLESTIGRESSSSSTGKKLKPLDPAKLTALYHIIADKNKMPNIQRTEDCTTTSPNFLTVKEQKMVREALSQYFNQLRQRQKRKRSNPDYICNNINNSTDESSHFPQLSYL